MNTLTIEPGNLVLADVLTRLRSRGLTNATPSRVHWLIGQQRIDQPEKDSSGRFRFTGEHVEQLAVLLAEMPSNRSQRTSGALAGADLVQRVELGQPVSDAKSAEEDSLSTRSE